jgi:hypothetical protein
VALNQHEQCKQHDNDPGTSERAEGALAAHIFNARGIHLVEVTPFERQRVEVTPFERQRVEVTPFERQRQPRSKRHSFPK